MPVVTVDPAKTERFVLKTAPADPSDPNDENGWVELRALPYGMKLTRRDKAAKMSMVSADANGQNPVSVLETFNEWAVSFDFAYCIVDHNLQDANHQKINFSKTGSVKNLDPRVGSEIERLINKLNEDEDEETLRDFLSSSNTSSTTDSDNLLDMELQSATTKET